MQIHNIIAVQDVGFENIVNATTKEFTMPVPVPVLHGVPVEYYVCTEWEAIDKLEPISPSYIGHQCIQMEVNIPTD